LRQARVFDAALQVINLGLRNRELKWFDEHSTSLCCEL
jgi:hypothetical protein